MTALFFGESERPLYGYFHAADFASDKRVGLLICNGLPHEYLRTHRMLKQLAVQLARQGVGVMRFDYPGTGDSWGHTTDATLDNWTASIAAAMEELEALSAADRFAILSVRAGTLICSQASLPGITVSRRICLDPVLDGASYLQSLTQAHAGMLADPLRFEKPRSDYRNARHTELLGNEYSPAFIARLQQLRLDAATLAPGHTLISTRNQDPPGGVQAQHRLDVDCRWFDGAALETQIVLPGLANLILEAL